MILYIYSRNTILFHSISSIICEQEINKSLEKSIIEDIEKKKYFKPEIIKVKPITKSNDGLSRSNYQIRDLAEERENEINDYNRLAINRLEGEREINRPADNSRTHLPMNNDNSNINQELQNRNNQDNSNISRQ